MKSTKVWGSMTDTFLSNWECQNYRINKLVIECNSWKEAEIVRDNAEYRTDQKYINICINKPYYSPRNYITSRHNKDSYPNWFKPNYFQGKR